MNNADRPTGEGKPKGRFFSTRWYVASLALHALVVLLLWFTPVRQLVTRSKLPDPAESRLTPRQVEEIVEDVRESATRDLDDMVRQLNREEESLRQELETNIEQYQQQARELADDAVEKALEAQQHAIDAQREAIESADWAAEKMVDARDEVPEDADEEQRKIAELTAQADRREAEVTQHQTSESQGEAADAQRAVEDALAFATEEFQEARDAQEEARDAQQDAARQQDRATEMYQRLEDFRNQIPRTESNIERYEKAVERYSSRAATQEERAEKYQQAVAKAQDAVVEARKAAEQSDDARAQKNLAQKEQDLKRAEQRYDAVNERAEDYAARAEVNRQQLQEARDRLRAMRQEQVAAKAAVIPVQEKVVDLQKQAQQAQEQAKRTVAQAAAKQTQQATETAQEQQVPVPQETVDALESTAPQNLTDLDIVELYEEAVSSEKRSAELYRQIKAAQTAVKTDSPLEETLADTEIPVTERPEVNAGLLRETVTSQSTAEAHRQELNKVREEIRDMVDSVARIRDIARASDLAAPAGMSVSLASLQAEAAQESELRELAAEDSAARYKDLSGAMKQATGQATLPEGRGGEGKPNRPEGPGGGGHANISQLTAPSPEAVPARRFVRSAQRAPHDAWAFVNRWYVIGPFPNPSRRNIDTQFPPESVIDLDASYRTEDGEVLRWQYQESHRARIRPVNDRPYSIFYAYTELWFEEAMDLTIAVGSDDYSRVWINGMVVWLSGKQRKSWRPDEGFRTVHFRKGLNRILYRLENGAYGSSFSLMIALQPPGSAE